MKKLVIEFCGECMRYVDDTCPIITHCAATEKPPIGCPLEDDKDVKMPESFMLLRDGGGWKARAEKAEAQIAVLVDAGFKEINHPSITGEHLWACIYCHGYSYSGSKEDFKHEDECLLVNLPSEATKLLEKLKQYEKALKFYGNESNWENVQDIPDSCMVVNQDKGKRARDSIGRSVSAGCDAVGDELMETLGEVIK